MANQRSTSQRRASGTSGAPRPRAEDGGVEHRHHPDRAERNPDSRLRGGRADGPALVRRGGLPDPARRAADADDRASFSGRCWSRRSTTASRRPRRWPPGTWRRPGAAAGVGCGRRPRVRDVHGGDIEICMRFLEEGLAAVRAERAMPTRPSALVRPCLAEGRDAAGLRASHPHAATPARRACSRWRMSWSSTASTCRWSGRSIAGGLAARPRRPPAAGQCRRGDRRGLRRTWASSPNSATPCS